MTDNLMTAGPLARHLGIAVTAVYRLRKEGTIQQVDDGKQYNVDDVLEHIDHDELEKMRRYAKARGAVVEEEEEDGVDAATDILRKLRDKAKALDEKSDSNDPVKAILWVIVDTLLEDEPVSEE